MHRMSIHIHIKKKKEEREREREKERERERSFINMKVITAVENFVPVCISIDIMANSINLGSLEAHWEKRHVVKTWKKKSIF